MAVDAKIQISTITSTTKTVIVAAPQANRTRIVPISAIVQTNLDGSSAATPTFFIDDNGTSEELFAGSEISFGGNQLNTFIVVLEPTQALEVQYASAGAIDMNIHASFLEHRPST